MATFAHLAGVELPKQDREGKPTIFDSYDMAPILFGEGTWERNHWEYFTEAELAPGAIRIAQWKAVFNLRGDGGAQAGLRTPRHRNWAGAAQISISPPCPRSTTSGRIPRSATTSS